jgi:hypothetical protein
VKKNANRIAKLEDKYIGNKSDFFRLSDLEILERIQELEFHRGMIPTQKFMDMKNVADRTKPIFTPKVCKRMREEQAETHAQIASMNDVELDDHLGKLIRESEMKDTFEEMKIEA